MRDKYELKSAAGIVNAVTARIISRQDDQGRFDVYIHDLRKIDSRTRDFREESVIDAGRAGHAVQSPPGTWGNCLIWAAVCERSVRRTRVATARRVLAMRIETRDCEMSRLVKQSQEHIETFSFGAYAREEIFNSHLYGVVAVVGSQQKIDQSQSIILLIFNSNWLIFYDKSLRYYDSHCRPRVRDFENICRYLFIRLQLPQLIINFK